MRILVTGAKGFIGKNLICELKNRKYSDILEFDIDTESDLLDTYCKESDFIFHLAGVNRPQNESEFMQGNYGFTSKLIESLKKQNNKAPVLITSSVQAILDNPYGRSKKAGEDLLLEYGKENSVNIYIYRLSNVFGKWCKPNYNSVVATFCHNIANGLDININDPNANITLVYIDDIINEFIGRLSKDNSMDRNYFEVPISYQCTVGKIAELIKSFKESRNNRSIPNMSDNFIKKLYSTYLSYLPEDQFSYELKMNTDNRGSFTEFIKTSDRGQVSVNISKPGITKGDHWHHTKNEKFLVVNGNGVIRFRKIDSDKIIEYFVSSDKMEVVDIPIGYTHNIENLGCTDMVTIMWANELFDSEKPDTYYLEVCK